MIRRKFSTSKAEWKYIEDLVESVNIPSAPHIRALIENALVWYVVRAKQYKVVEYLLNGITVITPTVILVLNECLGDDSACGQILVSIVGTIAASAQSFSKIHEKRINYRKTVENIKIEVALYASEIGRYSASNKNELFVQQICEFLKQEHAEWEKSEKKSETQEESKKTGR